MRMVLLTVLFAASLSARVVELPNSDFAKPEAQHRAAFMPEGFTLARGAGPDVKRWVGPAPHAQALWLGKGTALSREITLPATPESKLAGDGWYLVFSIDSAGMEGEYAAKLVATLTEPGRKPKQLARAELSVSAPAVTQPPAPALQRLWLRLSEADCARLAGKAVTLELAAEGGNVVIDDLRCEQFHRAPNRELLGKANGVLGPDLFQSGAIGLTALTEHMHVSLSVMQVRADSACAKAGLKDGDLIVAVDANPCAPSSVDAGQEWFQASHEAVIGRAVLAALKEKARKGAFTMTVLRADGLKELKLKPDLPALLDKEMPLDDKAGKLMHADMLAWIEKNQGGDGFWPECHGVNTPIAALALLGTRDRKHRKQIDAAVNALLRENPDPTKMTGLAYWTVGFQGMLFCEYHLATGDQRTLDWIKAAIEWLPTTTHKCAWGMPAFGHGPDGLPYEDKALMAPCAHLLVFDALARRCGVASKVWEHIEPYVMHSWSDPATGGHGGMGYNGSHKDTEEFWSRTGLTALALHLRKDKPEMRDALVALMAKRHAWMLNSHAYGEPGAALGLLALGVTAPDHFKEVMGQWRWRFVSAWQPGFGLRYSTPHMGSPYMGEEEIINPSYALLWTLANKGLVLSGGEAKRWLVEREPETPPRRDLPQAPVPDSRPCAVVRDERAWAAGN
ncbi:MAG: hypothetical protein KF754_10355 [Planctomycetes bacterium]|nr:hypothetical protein [Planctomycetota bacterium]